MHRTRYDLSEEIIKHTENVYLRVFNSKPFCATSVSILTFVNQIQLLKKWCGKPYQLDDRPTVMTNLSCSSRAELFWKTFKMYLPVHKPRFQVVELGKRTREVGILSGVTVSLGSAVIKLVVRSCRMVGNDTGPFIIFYIRMRCVPFLLLIVLSSSLWVVPRGS